MAIRAELESEPRFFFTAPWEPVVVRRGDALGLRALADQFAEAMALSNRVRDGRWVTILAWSLARFPRSMVPPSRRACPHLNVAMRFGVRPVITLARVGEHTGAAAWN